MSIICCMYGPIAIMRDTHHPSSSLASVTKLALARAYNGHVGFSYNSSFSACFSVEIVFFSHNKLIRIVFFFPAKRTKPTFAYIIYNILWTPRRLLRLMISYHLFEVRFLTAWIIYVITASSMFFNVFYVSLYVRKFLHIVLSRTAVNSHVVVCGPILDRNEHELYVLLFFMYRLV